MLVENPQRGFVGAETELPLEVGVRSAGVIDVARDAARNHPESGPLVSVPRPIQAQASLSLVNKW
jgi:hypothetical protein